MKILEKYKKSKQKLRPDFSLISRINYKAVVGALIVFSVIAFMSFMLHSTEEAKKQSLQLRQQVAETEKKSKKTFEEVKSLKVELTEKDAKITESSKKIEEQSKVIEEKTKSEESLKGELNHLQAKVQSLESAYGGYGGGVAVRDIRYTEGNSYVPGNCTWGVKDWKPETPNFWGNANQWDDNARAEGAAVNSSPAVGSIAQTDAGWAGHVALVVSVSGDEVIIKEMNGAGGLGAIETRPAHVSEFVYIHI